MWDEDEQSETGDYHGPFLEVSRQYAKSPRKVHDCTLHGLTFTSGKPCYKCASKPPMESMYFFNGLYHLIGGGESKGLRLFCTTDFVSSWDPNTQIVRVARWPDEWPLQMCTGCMRTHDEFMKQHKHRGLDAFMEEKYGTVVP